MAELDPLAVVMEIVRIAVAIGFVMFIIIMFFSFHVEVKEDSMKRFLVEVSDSLTSTNLVYHKSVFNPQKLTETERKNPDRNVELYAVNCDYGYSVDIESVFGETKCGRGDDCKNFCKTACGLDDSTIDMSILGTLSGNCGCNFGDNFCECKKPGEGWQYDYRWGYGYRPGTVSKNQIFATATSDLPISISVQDAVLPAKMTITAYDSFLTRLSCITQKAYELKDTFDMKFVRSNVYFTSSPTFRRTDTDGTHVCLYSLGAVGNEIPIDCRYLPDVPFERFQILRDLPRNANEGKIIAYPVKNTASCGDVKSNPSVIAGKNDRVATVILCMEDAK